MPSAKISARWKTIVLHHSATSTGGARAFDLQHRKRGWDGLGYHFVIGNGSDTPDGSIEVGYRWKQQLHGAHCKTEDNFYNDHGIGICLVGDFTKTSPTARQMASLKRLVRFLCERCRIPAGKLTSHGTVNPQTQCPGHRFNLDQLKRSLP